MGKPDEAGLLRKDLIVATLFDIYVGLAERICVGKKQQLAGPSTRYIEVRVLV